MPEQRKENDDWDGDPKQPKQNTSTEAHENLHFVVRISTLWYGVNAAKNKKVPQEGTGEALHT